MRSLIFLCGLVLGAFALLIGQNLGLVIPGTRPAAPRRSSPSAEDAAREARSAAPARDPAKVAAAREALEREMAGRRRKSLEPLAALLEEAIFQQDWNKVEAALDAIAAKGGDWTAAPPPPPSAPVVAAEPEERSLWQLQEELDRRAVNRSVARSRSRPAAIARSGDPHVKERLLEVLKSPASELERFEAALLLARTGDEPTIQELCRSLSSEDRVVRMAAGKALAFEGYISGQAELERLARSAPSAEVRETAVRALAESRPARTGEAQSAAAALVRAVREDESEPVRAAAAASLYATDLDRCQAYVDALIGAIAEDASPRVRAAASPPRAFDDLEEATAHRLVRAVERALATETDASAAANFLQTLEESGGPESEVALDRFAATPLGNALVGDVARAREAIRARHPKAAAGGAPR